MSGPASAAPFSEPIGHRSITSADLATFGGLTGDYARLHFDHSLAAAEPGSPGTIAHGLLWATWAVGALAWSAPERLGGADPDSAIAGFSIRLERSMRVGDRFALRHRPASEAAAPDLIPDADGDTELEVVNQRGERTGGGIISVRRRETAVAPAPMPRPVFDPSAGPRPLHAGDLVDFGPRGESIGRTISEADVVAFTNFTAERSPRYLNRPFAARGRFGDRIVPPLLSFCLGFGDFLADLLRVELPSTGMAGHLGDRFRCYAPVRIGDTLRTRHRPVRATPSRSRPGMSVVHFALQLLDEEDRVVQDGEVAMFIADGPPRR